MTTSQARIIELPKILDERGNLSFIEGGNHVPFNIRRTYWIYDVPGGMFRNGHAFREQEEFLLFPEASMWLSTMAPARSDITCRAPTTVYICPP